MITEAEAEMKLRKTYPFGYPSASYTTRTGVQVTIDYDVVTRSYNVCMQRHGSARVQVRNVLDEAVEEIPSRIPRVSRIRKAEA